MAQAYQCDLCGKLYPRYEKHLYLNYSINGKAKSYIDIQNGEEKHSLDICNDCKKILANAIIICQEKKFGDNDKWDSKLLTEGKRY